MCSGYLTSPRVAGSSLLPLVLSIGTNLPPAQYGPAILTPLMRMFASADRAMRMALLENLPTFADKLDSKMVVDKVWPNLVSDELGIQCWDVDVSHPG
jgi:SCY1-like protein 1